MKLSLLAIGVLVAASLYPQSNVRAEAGESFKASKFLTWERESQNFYIGTSVGMALLIAAQNDKAQASCLENWYYSDQVTKNNFILKTMERVPDYHPRGVILAVLEKQCKPLVYKGAGVK